MCVRSVCFRSWSSCVLEVVLKCRTLWSTQCCGLLTVNIMFSVAFT